MRESQQEIFVKNIMYSKNEMEFLQLNKLDYLSGCVKGLFCVLFFT